MRAVKVNPVIIKWYHSFLTGGRSQLVKVNWTHSLSLTTNTDTPRDASVLLYFTYCSQTVHPQLLETSLSNLQTTAIFSLLFAHGDIDTYFSEVNWFTEWCTDNFLELDTKISEMIFDPKSVCTHLSVVISDQTIKQVGSYKYLGIHTDSKLNWSVHVEAVCSWAQKHLYFLQWLRAFSISTNILLLFYCATIGSMIRSGITSFCENLSVQSRSQLLRIVSTSTKIVGCTLSFTPGSLQQTIVWQAQEVCFDASHLLYLQYQLLLSGEPYGIPMRRLSCYK